MTSIQEENLGIKTTVVDHYSDATKETGVFESSTAPLEGHFHGSEKPGLFCWITVAINPV
jgi:hypothetical protein